MPRIIDYEIVLERLSADGLNCNYPYGGSFGFTPGVKTQIRGWIGPPDETIRPEMRKFVRSVGEPYEHRLTELAVAAWNQVLPGAIWVMPSSHWSFELDHGSRDWLPGLLGQIGIDSRLLASRTNAAAIGFLPEDQEPFSTFLRGLLKGLTGSDFSLAFPGRKAIGLIHHHKQLWWILGDKELAYQVQQMTNDQ